MTINEKDILQIIEVEINSIFEKNFKRLFPFNDKNFENKLKDTIKIKVKNQIVYLLNLNNNKETLNILIFDALFWSYSVYWCCSNIAFDFNKNKFYLNDGIIDLSDEDKQKFYLKALHNHYEFGEKDLKGSIGIVLFQSVCTNEALKKILIIFNNSNLDSRLTWFSFVNRFLSEKLILNIGKGIINKNTIEKIVPKSKNSSVEIDITNLMRYQLSFDKFLFECLELVIKNKIDNYPKLMEGFEIKYGIDAKIIKTKAFLKEVFFG
jgi:hypothetical protein